MLSLVQAFQLLVKTERENLESAFTNQKTDQGITKCFNSKFKAY
jgi:hypothetical protein